MPGLGAVDVSPVLAALSQLQQSNAELRQRREARRAQNAQSNGQLLSVAGGVAGFMAGGPVGAAAGSAAGYRIGAGDQATPGQMASTAFQAYQMGQGQQQYQAQQAQQAQTQAAMQEAGAALAPPPTAGPVQGDEMMGTPAAQMTPGKPDYSAAGRAFLGSGNPALIAPAISLLSAGQKTMPENFTLGEGQGRYDATGQLIAERQKPAGADDPQKTEFERSIVQVADRAIERGDITQAQRPEFLDNLRRQKLARAEITASGGKIEGLDVKAAIDATKAATSMSAIPGKAGEKPFTPEQAAKVAMINSAITTHAGVRAELSTQGGGFDRQKIATMNANVPFSEGRVLRQQMKDAIEARLRAESGAAVPDSEVERAMDRFMPSSLDSDASIQSKLDRFEAWLKDTSWLINEGRAKKPVESRKEQSLKSKYGLD